MIIVGKEEVTVKNELYEKWDDILENMKTEFEISAPIYRTFVKTLSIYHVEGNKLTVLIDDVKIGNSKSFVEQRYSLFLAISIEEFTGIQYDISFVSRSELGQQKLMILKRKKRIIIIQRSIPNIRLTPLSLVITTIMHTQQH